MESWRSCERRGTTGHMRKTGRGRGFDWQQVPTRATKRGPWWSSSSINYHENRLLKNARGLHQNLFAWAQTVDSLFFVMFQFWSYDDARYSGDCDFACGFDWPAIVQFVLTDSTVPLLIARCISSHQMVLLKPCLLNFRTYDTARQRKVSE